MIYVALTCYFVRARMQVPHGVVRQFYLAICQALPVGDMVNIISDQLRFGSTIGSTAVNSYVDCLKMVNNDDIVFWCVGPM